MGVQDPPEQVQQDINADRVHSFEWLSESTYKVVYDLHRFNRQNTSTNADAIKIQHLENRSAACEREKTNLVEANSALKEKIQLLENRLAACERENINQGEAKSSLEEAFTLLTARCEQLEGSLEEKETELQVGRQNLVRCEHAKTQILQKVDELTTESKKICGDSKEAIATLNGLILIEQEDKEQMRKAADSSAAKAARKIQSLEAKLDASEKSAGNLRSKLNDTEETLVLEILLKDKVAEQVKANETLMHAQVQKISEQEQTINNISTQRMEEAQMAWEDPLAWEVINEKTMEALAKQQMEEAQMTLEDINIEPPRETKAAVLHEIQPAEAISNPDEASVCEQSSEQPPTIEILQQQMEKLELKLAAAATSLEQRNRDRGKLFGPEYFQESRNAPC
uniref:Uncharacterized protein n=1 Tax=Octactis speculum TaxID=3111310 RepID=A0A6U3SE26_9STRA